jgi:aromatic-L-amino-acid decarboxylase
MGEEILREAAESAISYLAGIGDRPVRPEPIDLSPLGGPLPEGSTDSSVVMKLLDEMASPATMAMAGPRFFGWVIGGA